MILRFYRREDFIRRGGEKQTETSAGSACEPKMNDERFNESFEQIKEILFSLEVDDERRLVLSEMRDPALAVKLLAELPPWKHRLMGILESADNLERLDYHDQYRFILKAMGFSLEEINSAFKRMSAK